MFNVFSYLIYILQIKNIDDSLNTNLSIINDALYRLETFQMIQDTETDTLLNDDVTMKEWIRFLRANLLEECTTRLSMVYNYNYTYIAIYKSEVTRIARMSILYFMTFNIYTGSIKIRYVNLDKTSS